MNAGLNALLNKTFHRDGNRAETTGGNRAETTGITRLPARWRESSSPDKAMGAFRGDSLVLSEPLKALRGMGVDLEGSTFVSKTQMLSFNMQFKDEQIKSLTSNGTFDYRAQSLQVDFSFHSALTVKDDSTGVTRQELFQFDFHLDVSRVELSWGDEKVEKEDILNFARRILNKISKLHSEGKKIDGLALGTEDLKDLGAVDEGKLLKNIMAIVNLLRNMDPTHGKNGRHVMLEPERGRALVKEAGEMIQQSSSMSLSVQRMSAIIAESDDIEVPVTEAASA